MKRSTWKDRDIEELIGKLPKVRDSQTQQEIYANIKRENRKNKTLKFRWIPVLASLTALFIIVLLSPILFSNDNNKKEESQSLVVADKAESMKQVPFSDKENGSTSSKESILLKENEEKSKFQLLNKKQLNIHQKSVYEEDLVDRQLLTYGLVTSDAITIPISVLIPKSNSSDWLEDYKRVSYKIPEQQWGFDDYYPLKGNIEWNFDHSEIYYELPKNNPYSGSSASEYAFIYALKYSFKNQNVDNIRFITEEGNAPEFDQMGKLMKLSFEKEKGTPFFIHSPNGINRYFVPKEESFTSLSEAIDSMKVPPDDFYQAVVPKEINWNVKEKGKDTVKIMSLNELDLTQYSDQTVMELIEGILLTAKSFGYKYVEFENIQPIKWNMFDFSSAIKTPISPNKKNLP